MQIAVMQGDPAQFGELLHPPDPAEAHLCLVMHGRAVDVADAAFAARLAAGRAAPAGARSSAGLQAAQVAYRLGFSDPACFNRFFTRMGEVPPSR
ncbi:hypothetical protein [Limimaricola cinnabarinus]|uniref:hypothetical protein n=1 Tax=Limimaricola cinnabarinus TaxID=1125964 RepID=UPI002FE35A7F